MRTRKALVPGRAVASLGLLALLLVSLLPAGAEAQLTQLAVSGFPLSVTSTTGADFEQGFVLLGNTTVTVNSTLNILAFSPRVTTVQVRCAPACPRSGTLPMARLEWRRADLATWNDITTTFATIETRTVVHNGTNDPWTQTVQWRYELGWTTSPPAAASAFYLEFRMVVTAP